MTNAQVDPVHPERLRRSRDGDGAQFKRGRTVSGRGIFLVPLSDVDPETGEMTPVTCFAHACMVVDDETGEVLVVAMNAAYELGRTLNPRLAERQLVGGVWMGMSHALYETTEPYHHDRLHGPRDFDEYLMPGPGDVCERHIAVLERPAPDGPFGGKDPGEMRANPVLPAIASAVLDAVGVRVGELGWACAHCGARRNEPLALAAKRHGNPTRAVIDCFRALESGWPSAAEIAAAKRRERRMPDPLDAWRRSLDRAR